MKLKYKTAYELNCMTINTVLQSSLLILILDLLHISSIGQFLRTIPFIRVERVASNALKMLLQWRTCYSLLRTQTFAKDYSNIKRVSLSLLIQLVFRHSVPKLPCECHFKTSGTFWSRNCNVLDCNTQATTEKEQCKPYSKAHKL